MHRSARIRLAAATVTVAAALGGGMVAFSHAGGTSQASAATGVFAARAGAPMGGAGDLAAAAAYLGISQAGLQTKLRAGSTLAQVAAATAGKSKAGLVAALVAAEIRRPIHILGFRARSEHGA